MLFLVVAACIAFLVGVLVGWVWKPTWWNFRVHDINGEFSRSTLSSSPSVVISSPVSSLGSTQSLISRFESTAMKDGLYKDQISLPFTEEDTNCSSLQLKKEQSIVVTEEDLEHLCNLVERKDGGPPWKHMMDHCTPTMSYQSWQRDPETGPSQYCTRTVYEDATPEQLRDFFWDDEFRLKWDNMIVHCATLEECKTTGTMVVHWIRKFPFFCSDREYTIGRRIWESGRSYYCVTKVMPDPIQIRFVDRPRECPALLFQGGTNRDVSTVYYSSWCIQAVASKKESELPSACEVILFHHEDVGVPKEIAKFAVRQGMLGTVKNIERGLRAYQKARSSGAPLSQSAILAGINTKLNPAYLKSLESAEDSSEIEVPGSPENPGGLIIPKLVIFGGAIVLACTLNRGLLSKAIVFGVVKRFGNIGRRL
ncbi:hypothetical protein HYC85_013423 [Camellia sinensis]|uniref:START domain-containing protein n=1 Tax=Camellia sinensis TaxID=4442 RepID=A0A7J7H6Q7_CAMSI|nr:hypothetical protein HYC85_013423 [Camellia sinensis]